MKKQLTIIILFLTSQIIFSQKPDYSLSADFVYGEAELDSFVMDNFVRPKFCLEKGVDMDIWLQFTVDSLSGISFVRVMDIQATHDNWSDLFKIKIDSLKPEFKAEAIRVIKETAGFWIPKELDGKPTWELIEYRMEIRTPEFTKNREAYLRTPLSSINSHAYSNYLDIPADNAIKYYNLGVKKMEQKKHYIAIKYFQKSIELGNKSKDVYYNLGVAEYLYGLIEDACKSWSKAVVLGDEDAKVLLEKNCK